jgi:electron transport complex protein RnfD
MKLLTVSPSPHVHDKTSVNRIMYDVLIALIPAFIVSIYFFGFDALRVTFISVAFCVFFEWLINLLFFDNKLTIRDGSAAVTGVLLAFNLPSNIPWWIIMIGSLVSIGIAKMTFGGLGNNIFNPALVGRIFLLFSFPTDMTVWPVNRFALKIKPDAITGATPLAIIKEGLKNNESISAILNKIPDSLDLLFGNVPGSLGEISALALIIGGIYLLLRRVITWHIPVSFILTVFIFTGIVWLVNPEKSVSPLIHILSGGLMLGAIFMATDMVTSPMSKMGQLIFGIGCGIITSIIRIWGIYPEGVSFAIVFMNAITPLINAGFKPKKFGK